MPIPVQYIPVLTGTYRYVPVAEHRNVSGPRMHSPPGVSRRWFSVFVHIDTWYMQSFPPRHIRPPVALKQLACDGTVTVCKAVDSLLFFGSVSQGVPAGRFTQAPFRAFADLASLGPVTAKRVCLGLVTQQGRQDKVAAPPQSIRPQENLDPLRYAVPSLKELGIGLMKQMDLSSAASIRTLSGPSSTLCHLVPKHWDHAHYQPATWFGTHFVVDASQGHCTAHGGSDTYTYIQILSNTCTIQTNTW